MDDPTPTDERLDESQERSSFAWLPSAVLSTAVEVISDGVLICDSSGTIVQVNDAFARLCRRERWELEGAPVASLADVEGSDDRLSLDRLLEVEGEWAGRVHVRRGDGAMVECEGWVTIVEDAEGPVVLGIVHALGVNQRFGKTVVDDVDARVHSLINSLSSIRGYVDLLQRGSAHDQDLVLSRLSAVTETTTARLAGLLAELSDPGAGLRT